MTLRYRLRTLLIVLAIGPPVLAAAWFAAVWVNSNLQVALVTLLLVSIYVAGVALALWAKRISLALLTYVSRRYRG